MVLGSTHRQGLSICTLIFANPARKKQRPLKAVVVPQHWVGIPLLSQCPIRTQRKTMLQQSHLFANKASRRESARCFLLAPFDQLAKVGVTLCTDDGNGVQSESLMQEALVAAKNLNITMAQHCEVSEMTIGAAMHDGECCSHLGVPGWPAEAEVQMVRRDIELVRRTGGRLHLLHLSTAESVALVRDAKKEGLPITAEVTPHHLSLQDTLLKSFNPIFKVNPPLRTPRDIEALKEGLVDGTIDAIATDHAPHAGHSKEQPLDVAPPGMLGLETALAVVNTAVTLDVQELVALMSWNPARIAGLQTHQGRPIAVGEPANIAVWDTTSVWTVQKDALASKSKNTPYHGMSVRGRVHHTIFNGELVVHEGKALK
jgi:dihydroorotase